MLLSFSDEREQKPLTYWELLVLYLFIALQTRSVRVSFTVYVDESTDIQGNILGDYRLHGGENI